MHRIAMNWVAWGLAQTAALVAGLQNPDGGFAGAPGGKSSLGTTSSAIRVLKNTGGSIPDVPGCIKFVRSCYDADTGGFAPTPGGTPDVGTTATGMMAVAELRVGEKEMVDKAIAYLEKNARDFGEVRIAVAALESVKKTSSKFDDWTKLVNSDRNPDGTWGQGAAKAFETGGHAVALLRMGVKLDTVDAIVAAMKAGQRPDGGWSEADGPSDLSATYRIMRCFWMLRESPDLEALESFIASCRQSDGGYATRPGGEASLGGAYFATTVLGWARQLSGEPAVVETAGFTPLFNGKDLSGWEGDTSLWSARDGMLVGKSPGIKQNQFLATEKSYGDFVLKLTFRLVDGKGNSGVQFRSTRIPGTEMSGYQADIGEGYWGSLYDESRRNKTLVAASDKALAALQKTGWNEYVIRAMGDHITLRLHGEGAVDYRETDPDVARSGKVAVQIHAGGPMEVQFKDVYIQPLPTPAEDGKDTPGFHLRTVKAPDGERKYSVFLPGGYDGSKAFPVVLFLHGAGERGEGGVVSAQVGLGAAIAGHPEDYPFIALFPQAKETWRADSADIKAALAALDDVMGHYKVDRERVILTGLSMGGAGTWGLAAAQPERFSAIVPVCGFGPTDLAPKVKDLPIWSFLGDADMERIVQSTRSILDALRDAGARPRQTEYRGVGHNSWDRAYNEPALVDWMLAQRRPARP